MASDDSAQNENLPPNFMEVEMDDIDEDIPFEVMQNAELASLELLPVKSREKYYRVYNVFKKWQNLHGIKTISSQIIMAYFFEMDKKNYKPTSLWAYYSMLKATIRVKENIDIGKFAEVVSFLKAKASGFKSVKAEVFTEAQLKQFFDSAAELQWLDAMVICIFGICGACRTDEFLQIKPNDVEKHSESLYLVRLNQTKTKIPRSFTITGKFVAIVDRYIKLRPEHADTNGRFFVNYQRGKCTVQNMGRNKFSKMPRRIAEYLKLPLLDRYTGHSFRRTSATILANSGADMETIMRHGGWRNEKSAKGYIEDSIHYKQRTGNMIIGSILGPVECAALAPTPTFAGCSPLPPDSTVTGCATLPPASTLAGCATLPPASTVAGCVTLPPVSAVAGCAQLPPVSAVKRCAILPPASSVEKRAKLLPAPTDAVFSPMTPASTDAKSAHLTRNPVQSLNLDSFFDEAIDESELIEATERFSQQECDRVVLRDIQVEHNKTGTIYSQHSVTDIKTQTIIN